MTREFVPYEQALALKELGFDEPCLAFYSMELKKPFNITFHQGLWESNKSQKDCRNNYLGMLAPLYQQAFRWFREKHNWQHSIEPTADQHSHQLGYNYWIWNYKTKEEYHTMPKNRPTGDWEYKTYEEAELECLNTLIKIVKNK